MEEKPVLKQALLSVSDKTNLVSLAEQLIACGINIIATGGTASLLEQSKVPITPISKYTGFPEILDGRVKTLHPKIHAGLLARPDLDQETLNSLEIPLLELLVVNLYPFKETIQNPNCTLEQAIEQIDIGGPTMIRAAAKNFASTTVVIDPSDYPIVISEIHQYGNTTLETRRRLATKAFTYIADYDQAIANYFNNIEATTIPHGSPSNTFSSSLKSKLPEQLNLFYQKIEDLRYGENPHQAAALYEPISLIDNNKTASYQVLQGGPLSYNNMVDSDTAIQCVLSWPQAQTGCVIIKHATPCGAALSTSAIESYKRAYETDVTSAFGGIIAFNQPLNAEEINFIINNQFIEILIAPYFSEEALAIGKKKPKLKILSFNSHYINEPSFIFHQISSKLLVQEFDSKILEASELKVVTHSQPNEQQIHDLLFAWSLVKFVKSNAIVLVKDQATLGIGAGQTSRVFSTEIAISKAQQAQLSLQNSVMASDAFLPFADNVYFAAKAGISTIIQTGGSKRDPEVIAAADELGLSMVFTGFRHFRH